jgi:hypothetical protein
VAFDGLCCTHFRTRCISEKRNSPS